MRICFFYSSLPHHNGTWLMKNLSKGQLVVWGRLLVSILSWILPPCDWLRTSGDKNKGMSWLSYPALRCRSLKLPCLPNQLSQLSAQHNAASIKRFQDLKSEAQVTWEAAFTDKEDSQRRQLGLNTVSLCSTLVFLFCQSCAVMRENSVWTL